MSKSPVPPPKILLSAAMEKVINFILVLDPFHAHIFEPFEDKAIRLEIAELGEFYLIFHQGKVAVQTTLQGEPDATIETDLYSLKHLKTEGKLHRVTLSGDVALAQKLIQAFIQLDPDWEEALSQTFGDIIGFQISQLFQKVQQTKQKRRQYLGDTLAEYLQFEIQLLPTRHQIQHWQTEVQATTEAVNTLETRIQKLENLPLK